MGKLPRYHARPIWSCCFGFKSGRTPKIQRLRTRILQTTHAYPVIYADKKCHKTEELLPVDFSYYYYYDDFIQVTSHSERDSKESMWWQNGVTLWYHYPISKGVNRKGARVSNQSRVQQHLPFLCTYFQEQWKDLIAHANKGQMAAIGEIALHLLKGNFVMPNSSFKWVKPPKSKLLYLNHKKPSLKGKKAVLNQKGEFWSAHPSLIASFATELLGKVLK